MLPYSFYALFKLEYYIDLDSYFKRDLNKLKF